MRNPVAKRRHPDRWTVTDSLLAMALTAHEDSLCSCGQPRDRAWNDDMAGGFYAAHTATCVACQALEQLAETSKPQPGEYRWVGDVAPDGFMPDGRMTTVD